MIEEDGSDNSVDPLSSEDGLGEAADGEGMSRVNLEG